MPALATARLVLAETRNAYPLGSDNVRATQYNPRTDSYAVNRSLLDQRAQSRGLRALIDPDVTPRRLNQRSRGETAAFIQQTGLAQQAGYLSQGDRRRVVRQFMADHSSSRGAGNCDEMATYAFLRVEEHHDPHIVQNEIVYVAQPAEVDHVFVVINRPGGSNIGNWRTWGVNTIILDPWINRVFTAPNLLTEWRLFNPFGITPASWVTARQFDRNAFWNAP